MAYSLGELCRLVTKYTLCPDMTEPSLSELKKRFAGFDWCADKATAAAFGYYAAMEEFNGKKTIAKDIHDQCTLVIEDAQGKAINSLEAADRLFTLIYHWLDDALATEGYDSPEEPESVRHCIHFLFQDKLIDKEWIEKYLKE